MNAQDRAAEVHLALLVELAQQALDREATMRRLIEGQTGMDHRINYRVIWSKRVH